MQGDVEHPFPWVLSKMLRRGVGGQSRATFANLALAVLWSTFEGLVCPF